MARVGEKLNEIKDLELEAFHANKSVKIKLSDYFADSAKGGKWLVLAFYPADFTFVCPTELEELADLYEEFAKQDAEVMSVSTDTVFVHKAWHDVSPSIKRLNFQCLRIQPESYAVNSALISRESAFLFAERSLLIRTAS